MWCLSAAGDFGLLDQGDRRLLDRQTFIVAADDVGNAAAVKVRLIVWCLDCQHQVEPDPAEMADRYGAETAVLDWHARLVCGECGSRRVDVVVTRTER